VLVALGLHGSPVAASEWRVVFGSSLVEWDADDGAVPAGECPDGSCHGFDLETANLTDGLGAHFALEYLFNREATIRWFAGSQLDLTAAEYRSSQRSLGIGELHLVGGVEANLGALRPVVRAGAGYAVAEPGSSAAAMFVEPSLHIALSAEAGIRLGYRWSSHGDADSEDLVVSLVAPLDKPGMSGQWDLSWAAGALLTGPFGSEDLGLRSGPYWQLGVHKHVDLVRGRLGLIVQGAARESPLSLRFPREIDLDETVRIGGLSIQWDREMDPYLGLPWQLGGGITVADWDKDFFTLLNQHQELLKPAVEVGAYLMAQIRLLDYRGARLIAGVEPVYWPELDLYEVRARLGFEISP
jgi:hypothetical protein